MQNVKILDKDVLETLRICYLYAELGMTYQEIADYLDVSSATIGRRIQLAKKEGWLIDRLDFVPPEDFEDIDNAFFIRPKLDLEEKLYDRFSDYLGEHDRITIVPSGGDIRTAQRYAAAAAARLLERKIVQDNILGVNWGTTTYAIAKELDPTKPNPQLICVPIFGNLGLPKEEMESEFGPTEPPILQSTLAYESSGVAHLISQKFGAQPPVWLSFQAFMPEEFSDEGSDRGRFFKEYLNFDNSYQEVFGKHGLANRLDTIISSIGNIGEECAWFRFLRNLPIKDSKRDPKNKLRILKDAGVIGDIGQFFVTQQGFAKNSPPQIEEVNKQVVGLNLKDHFISLVSRYRENPIKGAGLVIVTVGSSKAAITIATIRTGVNHLIIDESLANEILNISG